MWWHSCMAQGQQLMDKVSFDIPFTCKNTFYSNAIGRIQGIHYSHNFICVWDVITATGVNFKQANIVHNVSLSYYNNEHLQSTVSTHSHAV